MSDTKGKQPAPQEPQAAFAVSAYPPPPPPPLKSNATAMPRPARRRKAEAPEGIAKCPTGIRGLDDSTQGGLPRSRRKKS